MKYFDANQGAALRSWFEEAVLGWPGVSTRTMFGCPCYRVNDTLFALLVTRGVVLTRLARKQREDLKQRLDAIPFRAENRTVNKWVQTDVDQPSDLEALLPFVETSYERARQNAET